MSRVVEYSVVSNHERNAENHSGRIHFAHRCGHPHRSWTANSGVDMVCHGFFCNGDKIPSLGGAERYAGSLVVAVPLDVVVM